jgi:hypothetical protein
MPFPWLRIIDGVLGATDLVRRVRGQSSDSLEAQRPSGGLETRLAGVIVSALKEAFDRDRQRIEFERQRLDEERERAERLVRMEWLRQSADREISRLRLVAALAAACWLGTLFLAPRLTGGGPLARAMVGLGWALLLAALAGCLAGQSRVSRALGQADDRSSAADITGSGWGAAAPWLVVAGLAVIAVGVLVA